MLGNLHSEATRHNRKGFSLIELVIVVVIIGIIGAIAIPRISRGASGASDSALVANLAVLRNAIDLYATEHQGTYPAIDGSNPTKDIVKQLTEFTDINGNAGSKDSTHIYGPYLRSIPALPVGTKKGNTGIAAADATGVGWIYNATNGTITANTSETDAAGKAYNQY